jgi:hypothetical protein
MLGHEKAYWGMGGTHSWQYDFLIQREAQQCLQIMQDKNEKLNI